MGKACPAKALGVPAQLYSLSTLKAGLRERLSNGYKLMIRRDIASRNYNQEKPRVSMSYTKRPISFLGFFPQVINLKQQK